MGIQQDTSILIVGAGVFGLSTAWSLARNGYKNVKVIDKHQAPSQDSAGYDLNKVFRTSYADATYTKLAVEARDLWVSEKILEGCYHESGYIFAVLGKSEKSVKNWQAAVDNSVKNGAKVEKLEKPEDFRAKAPVMTGALQGWKGVYDPKAGWTHAFNSLQAVYNECVRLGVKFEFGPSATAKSVLYGSNGQAVGILAEDGTEQKADRVVLACGAWMDSIIDTKGQSLAKCWCFIHIKLTGEEAQEWKGMPVINNRELGYLFEPDIEGRRLKIAPHGVGYTHYMTPGGKSHPRSKTSNPTDGIPSEDKERVRELLRMALPTLAERPFEYERMCWDADTPDANFLITQHPEHPGLYVAGGASAHGFKFLPNVGKYITHLLEDRLDGELAKAWRWRPYQQIVQDTSRPDRPNADLKDLEGWMNERAARL